MHKTKFPWNNKPGFSLIELLVALGVLAVLSAGIISRIGVGPQQYSRDSRRQADLENVKSALELARNDLGGYPRCSSGSSCQPGSIANISTYISNVPTDPKSGRNYTYLPSGCSGSTCSSFTLCAALEKITTPVSGCGSCGATCSVRITNP